MKIRDIKRKFQERIKYLLQMLKLLWKLDKSFFYTSVAEIAVVSVSPFVSMYLFSYAISALTNMTEFSKYAIIILSLLLLLLLLNLLHTYISNQNTIKGNLIGQRLYTEILNKCLELDYQKLLDKDILDKQTLATKALEGGAFTALIVNFKNITANLIVILGVITIVSNIDFYILLLALLVIAINGILSFWGQKQKYNTSEEMTPLNRKIGYYVDLSTNHSVAKEVRIFNMKEQLISRYKKLYGESLNILKKLYRTERNINYSAKIVNSVLEICIYLYLGYSVLVERLITVSDFSLYGSAIRQFKDSVSGLLGAFIDVDSNGRYLKNYFEFIELECEFNKGKDAVPLANEVTIKFENVSFRYPNATSYALKNINLTLSGKKCISLVGENGSGKTTFIKLLTRLCDPTEGTIYLNGVDIKTIDYIKYQQIFSTIFQDFNLYAFTIRENITMLNYSGGENDEDINNILQQIGLESRIRNTANGLDTYLYYIYDDKGIELSGGEGQKLAMARAIYRKSDIIILDEPTAALDPRAEYEILTDFHNITRNRMAIYISHRLSSCRFSDAIAVFKNGEIVEYGNHKSLIAKNGLYAELYNMQAQFYLDNDGSVDQIS